MGNRLVCNSLSRSTLFPILFLLGVTSRIGIVFVMIGFGAAFGYTVMARVSLLIGRLQFLLGDWLGIIQ